MVEWDKINAEIINPPPRFGWLINLNIIKAIEEWLKKDYGLKDEEVMSVMISQAFVWETTMGIAQWDYEKSDFEKGKGIIQKAIKQKTKPNYIG